MAGLENFDDTVVRSPSHAVAWQKLESRKLLVRKSHFESLSGSATGDWPIELGERFSEPPGTSVIR